MNNPVNSFKAVVVGVSAGGFKAIHSLLSGLPSDFPLPVIIVQHRKGGSDNYLIESLDRKCRLLVKEADEKEEVKQGYVYVAPADYHLLIESEMTFSLCVDEPVCFARPSIDVLFESAARAFGSRLIGIILTGANDDGSKGIREIKERGGITIAQDPQTAEYDVMPLSAISTNAVDFVLPLDEIPSFLISLLEENSDSHDR